MLPLKIRKEALFRLGLILSDLKNRWNSGDKELEDWALSVQAVNAWFTSESLLTAITAWSQALQEDSIEAWMNRYSDLTTDRAPRTIGVINAGNIPWVGLHDALCVFLSGHTYLGKNASDDPILLPWIINRWMTEVPELKDSFRFTERLSGMDAVIATGSDNSSRYFEHYFGKYPHIIRRNRNGIAILDGHETDDELDALGKDIFTYFGLGCRSVSKLFVPNGYDFDRFFQRMFAFAGVMGHHKYMNNFDYHHAILLLKQLPFLQNNFLILREEKSFASPISVLHYETYDCLEKLFEKVSNESASIQVAVIPSSIEHLLNVPVVLPGRTQFPGLADYADGVDTVRFLLDIR